MDDPTACCAGLVSWLPPELCRALGDPNRVAILERLVAGQGRAQSVSEVACCCPVDLSVVSRHLRVLRDAGVVEARKQGKRVLYRLRTAELVRRLRALADALEDCCPHGSCELEGDPDGC